MDPILLHADSYHGSASRLDEGQLRSASLEGTLTTRASFEGVGCASSFLRSLLGSLLRGGLLARLLKAVSGVVKRHLLLGVSLARRRLELAATNFLEWHHCLLPLQEAKPPPHLQAPPPRGGRLETSKK